MPITRRPLGNSGAASSIQSLLARLPWMKTTVTSPLPHSRQPNRTSPACTLDIGQPYLLRPAVGEDPAGVGASGNADTAAPLIMRSVPRGELVSTTPLV